MHYDAGGAAVSPLHEVAPLDERCRTSPVGHARILLTFAPLKISRCFHTEQEAGAWACRRGSASVMCPLGRILSLVCWGLTRQGGLGLTHWRTARVVTHA